MIFRQKTKWKHIQKSGSHTEHWLAGIYGDWMKTRLHGKFQLTQKTTAFTDESGNEVA